MPETRNQPLHIAVCDDEPIDRQQAASLTREIMAAEGLACKLSSYESGGALLAAIESGTRFHILLLDVMMDGLDGMVLAAALRELGDRTAIVFISLNREMALRGYEVSAARYLAKPLDREKLREALLYCYNTGFDQKEALLPTMEGKSRVRLSDILYAESQGHSVCLTLTAGKLTVNLMISAFAALLPETQFVFCHRTVLVNLNFVEGIRRDGIVLKNGTKLPVSKYRLPEVRLRLLRYLGR